MNRPYLFIGDSITDTGRQEDPDALGSGYVRMVQKALPGQQIVNKGISGNRVRDLRDRWPADALAHEPQVLTIYVGINDTWRRFDSNDPTSSAEFAADYRVLLESARDQTDARIVLMEPFVAPVTDEQRTWFEDLDGKRAVVATLAREFGAEFVPLQSLMNAASEEFGAEAIAPDGVHPSERGHRIIADAWLALSA